MIRLKRVLFGSDRLLGLGILTASIAALSGCEIIDGNLQTSGLQLIDTRGRVQVLQSGPVRLKLKASQLVFLDGNGSDKVKISIPSGYSVPSPGQQVTIAASRTGQQFDIVASAQSLDRGSNSSVNRESCDCDRTGCYGERDVTTISNNETIAYDLRFVQVRTNFVLGDFTATENRSAGSSSSAGPCFNVRPRPVACPPGTVLDRSIGRCVSVVTPPRPFPPNPPRPVPPRPVPQPPIFNPGPGPRPIPNPGSGNCPPTTHWDPSIQRCVR